MTVLTCLMIYCIFLLATPMEVKTKIKVVCKILPLIFALHQDYRREISRLISLKRIYWSWWKRKSVLLWWPWRTTQGSPLHMGIDLFVRMSNISPKRVINDETIELCSSRLRGQDILCLYISVLLSVCESQILSFILLNLLFFLHLSYCLLWVLFLEALAPSASSLLHIWVKFLRKCNRS